LECPAVAMLECREHLTRSSPFALLTTSPLRPPESLHTTRTISQSEPPYPSSSSIRRQCERICPKGRRVLGVTEVTSSDLGDMRNAGMSSGRETCVGGCLQLLCTDPRVHRGSICELSRACENSYDVHIWHLSSSLHVRYGAVGLENLSGTCPRICHF